MAISDRITSIEEHIKESYQELEGLGIDTTGVNNNLENIPKLIDGYWETLPKVTGEGTSITLDNTKEGKMKINLKGNTSQEGTPTPETPQDIHVVSGDNTITISKDGFENIELESGYIDSNNVIQSATGWKHSDYIDITGYEYYVVDMNLGNAPKSILYDSNKQPIQVFSIQYQGTYNLSNYPSAKYIRISSQEVYLNKQHLIVKSDYQVNLPVKNLCDIENVDKVGVYATYTYNNGVITMTPTQTTNACRLQFVIPKSYFEIGKTYTLSCIGANKFAIGYASSVSDTSHFNYFGSANSGSSLSFTYTSIPNNYVCFYLYNKEATLGTDWTITNIQVELGNKVNSYSEYGTSPLELCKIGDYQDSIVKDNGKWYLNKYINKYILNENSGIARHTSGVFYLTNITDYLKVNAKTSFANYYQSIVNVSSINDVGVNQIAFGTGSANRVFINDQRFSNVTDYNTWLSTHNTTVYYVLATPTYTEITDSTLLSQLNALAKSYTGQTNISQNNNDLASLLNATALEEME